MPSTPPPDGPQVYVGETLEEAMAAAVAEHGPAVVVERARRVRAGVRGLLGRDRYEVVVAASPAVAAAGADPLASAFASLLEDVEAREQAAVPPPPSAPPTPSPSDGARPAWTAPPPRSGERPADEDPDVLEGEVVEEVRRTAPHPAPSVAQHATRPAGTWSRSRLFRLGVPAEVLSALPAVDPETDLDWLVALTRAIGARVRPPVSAPGPEAPAVVHGYELAGALAVLEAGCRGATPGTLTTAGRTVPATATELALVVRLAVVGG